MEVGDSYDIIELLSSPERDFLVRNNGDRVKVDSLSGKIVGILFVVLRRQRNEEATDNIVEAYNELSPKGDFEVVFVAAIEDGGVEDEELFDKSFSKMPWFAIPFFDLETRSRLDKLISMRSLSWSNCCILDSNGKVLQTWAGSRFKTYGAEWYPFTAERLNEIEEEDAAARVKMSSKSLLASPSRDFVISNNGMKVPISELEGKVVGVYMFESRCSLTLMEKLVEIYENLEDKGENFEIVFVNLHFNGGFEDEKSFEQNFERMPWLALPFMDKNCRKLWRIFGCPGIDWTSQEGILVIIGPGGSFVDLYGSKVVQEYGIEAYPFTRKRAAEMEKERLEALTLESLFAAVSHQDFLIRRDGAKIPFSDLIGKSILLFFASMHRETTEELLSKLIDWYIEIKRKDEAFEVIYVSMERHQTSFEEIFSKMPWLAFPWAGRVSSLFCKEIGCGGGGWQQLVAFGSDGHLLTKRALLRLETHGADAYPFTNDKLLREIYEDLAIRHLWNVTDEDGNEYHAFSQIDRLKLVL